MKKEIKYYIIGGIMLAAITFLGLKAFSKPKTAVAPPSAPPKRKGSVIIDEPIGNYELPAEVISRVGTNLRKEASTQSSIVYSFKSKTRLSVIGDTMASDGQWFKVTDGTRTGWVRSDVVDYGASGYGYSPSQDLMDFEAYSGFGDY